MDSRNGNAAAAASPLPQYHLPHALLALPDMDRPPAILEMWELEAVAAALPAKKRRLRETFDRLAASAPAPLPFRWDDLDAYISSLQYSATLRHRQRREELHGSSSRPAPAPAAIPAAPPATGHPMRALEKPSRPVHVPVPVPIPPVVSESEPVATSRDVQVVEESEPARAPAPPAPAAAVTGVDVGKGKKRKASVSSDEADAIHAAAIRSVQQEAQAEMPKMHEDVSAAAASPLEDTNCDGDKSMPVPPGPADGDRLAAAAAAAANTSTDETAQVLGPVPVSKIAAVVPQELPVVSELAAAPARHATNGRARRLPPQRSRRPPRPVAGNQEAADAANQNNDSAVAANTSRDGGEDEATPCLVGLGTASYAGVEVDTTFSTAQVADPVPVSKITGVRHEFPAATHHASVTPKVASFTPKQEQVIEEVVPDVEMEIVEAEEPTQERPTDEAPDVEMEIVEPEPEEMPPLIEEDAPPVVDKKASPSQVKVQEADNKVSPLALACSNGSLIAQAGVQQVDAASATVPKSSPAAMHDVPNVLQASGASKSAAATGLALLPPVSQDDACKVSPVIPPRRGDGLVQPGVSTDDTTQTAAACKSAPAGRDPPAVNATGLAPAAGREATSPPQKASNKHVLQKQHMPKQAYHGPVPSSGQKQNHSFSRNHGGRPAGSQPVPEAHAAAAAGRWTWNKKPGDGTGSPGHSGFATARGMQGDGGSNNKGNAKWKKPPMFCNKCGCRGHLAETCRTAKHLVALYQRAKEEEKNQICYRCGCTGHWSRKCRTPKHLVDLYQKDRAAKRAAQGTGSP
ncbi:unnamed protein product [Urochloa decumbens]|uniref:CCHC-type domain-containing protein n=1 Tax=Urochloa decumbens TaxID=240449 RepID=A0ABC8WY58_9POAL